MAWVIYKHTNIVNGKVYIGQTQNIDQRWAYDGHNYDPVFKFGKAIRKYGWHSFTHEIVEDNIGSQELANEREIYWISYYDSYKHGYNMTIGGSGIVNDSKCIGVYQISLEKKIIAHFNSISEASAKLDILAQNIGQCIIGKGLTAKGFYFLPDTIDVNNFILPKSKYMREVICVDTNVVFSSIKEASKKTGVSYVGIAKCCARESVSAGNFKWAYLDEYDDDWEPVLPKKTDFDYLKKAIICVESGQVWNSIVDCSIETGIQAQNLSQNCCKGHRTAKNKHYAYLVDFDEKWAPAKEYSTERRKKASTLKKEVYCYQKNMFYESASACSLELGIPVRAVSRCAKKDGDLISTHGYNFCYKEDWYEGWKPRTSVQGKRNDIKKIKSL